MLINVGWSSLKVAGPDFFLLRRLYRGRTYIYI